jgi:hypothetical protein
MERGPLSLVSATEVLLGRKSIGSSLENREYGHNDPSHWPRGILYQQKLALSSPASKPASSLADSGHGVLVFIYYGDFVYYFNLKIKSAKWIQIKYALHFAICVLWQFSSASNVDENNLGDWCSLNCPLPYAKHIHTGLHIHELHNKCGTWYEIWISLSSETFIWNLFDVMNI